MFEYTAGEDRGVEGEELEWRPVAEEQVVLLRLPAPSQDLPVHAVLEPCLQFMVAVQPIRFVPGHGASRLLHGRALILPGRARLASGPQGDDVCSPDNAGGVEPDERIVQIVAELHRSNERVAAHTLPLNFGGARRDTSVASRVPRADFARLGPFELASLLLKGDEPVARSRLIGDFSREPRVSRQVGGGRPIRLEGVQHASFHGALVRRPIEPQLVPDEAAAQIPTDVVLPFQVLADRDALSSQLITDVVCSENSYCSGTTTHRRGSHYRRTSRRR